MKHIFTPITICAAICAMPSSLKADFSPYIARVLEFCPAPGQFVNVIPEYEAGDTEEQILAKVAEQICGSSSPGMISLGAYGGYVTFAFDHPVVNVADAYDFKVNGNAIISDIDTRGGSAEPGIILVSVDANGNGLPDDEWFEIKGSDYDLDTTNHNFSITYYKPDPNHQSTPDPSTSAITDTQYIRWTSNDPATPQGYLQKNSYHTQDYWPSWLSEASTLTFSGARLAPNAIDIYGDGSYLLLRTLGEGYADNLPTVERYGLVDKGVKIDWAVKADGTPAQLEQIDFVRVYTALNQTCGQLGETSTEVTGGEDLHPQATLSLGSIALSQPAVAILPSERGTLTVRSGLDVATPATLYSTSGATVARLTIVPGTATVELPALPSGIYLLRIDGIAHTFRLPL